MRRLIRSWRLALRPQVGAMLLLGFSSGLPLLLIFATLSLWLREAGVQRSEVTYFSWAALGYAFKFVWAPLIDKLPVPWLTPRLGQRRSWLLLAQLAVAGALIFMALSDPATPQGLTAMAVGAVMLGFSAATQDIVIDAYRIEAAKPRLQALMAGSYVAGYRIGMLVAGALSLYLADGFGTTADQYVYAAWRSTYLLMAGAMTVGVLTTLTVREPARRRASPYLNKTGDYLRFMAVFIAFIAAFIGVYSQLSGWAQVWKAELSLLGWLTTDPTDMAPVNHFLVTALQLTVALAGALAMVWLAVKTQLAPRAMVRDTYLEPAMDFLHRYGKGALPILLLVGGYRISDIVLGAIANVFYSDMGFSKSEIATVTKAFGLWVTIAGGLLGGVLTLRYGVLRILMLGAALTVLTNLLFILQAQSPGDLLLLYLVIGADNLTAGLASAAFIAYLSSLTSLAFTAVQYAVFSSLMTLFPKLLAGYAGAIVDTLGYPAFFLGASLLGIPVLLLVYWAGRVTPRRQAAPAAQSPPSHSA